MAKKTSPKAAAAPKKAAARKTAPKPAALPVKKEIAVVSSPSWNIWDTGDLYKVRLSAPGLNMKDIKVSVSGKNLTISSTKEKKTEKVKKNYLVREHHYASWTRSIELPVNISSEGMRIRFRDGILKLDLHKSARS